jgi:uncharacterized protein (TIGR00730 family)
MKKVAIFCSARPKKESKLYLKVRETASELAKDGWVIVTGGGPGLMEAANEGAYMVSGDTEIKSLAHAIELPFEDDVNPYVQEHTTHDNFYTRLEYFSHCDAFIVAPGGIGTMLEMMMIYQLIQVGHIPNRPIICVGRMWRKLRDFIIDEMLESNFISDSDLDLIHYLDRFDQVAPLLRGLSSR